MLILALDRAAAALGLVAGMGLADARAMFPDLASADEDPAADRALLEAIADDMERWTPLVALAPPDGLLLDISGCAHLFGGEVAMAAAVRRRLHAAGISARLALAATVGCAHALARWGRELVAAPGREEALLRPLPVAALRLEPDLAVRLGEAGLERIGDLIERPRAPLAARHGASLMRRLDQALGRLDEPITPRLPVPEHMTERRLAEPIMLEAHVLDVIAQLGDALGRGLEAAGRGATRLEAGLFRVDGHVRRIRVGASRPLLKGAEMRRLFADRLVAASSEWEAGFGFDLIRLAAVESALLRPRQPGLDGTAAEAADLAFAGLVDHLAARLGPGRIRRLGGRDTHVPEGAMVLPPLGEAPPPPLPPPEHDSIQPSRPFRLLERPEPVEAIAEVPDGPPRRLRWRGAWHQVIRAEGPERIAPEWWRALGGEVPPTRDYFRVETEAGLRLWLFRAGLYGRETDRPDWHLHGIFL